jgi:hypothetical protein
MGFHESGLSFANALAVKSKRLALGAKALGASMTAPVTQIAHTIASESNAALAVGARMVFVNSYDVRRASRVALWATMTCAGESVERARNSVLGGISGRSRRRCDLFAAREAATGELRFRIREPLLRAHAVRAGTSARSAVGSSRFCS